MVLHEGQRVTSREELASFVHRWADGIVSNDVDRMASFTTKDWVLIDRPGAITRESFHEVVRSGRLQHHQMTHEVLDVSRHGEVAIVRTRGRNTGTFDGEHIEADEWTTNVLVRQDDGWRCVLTQFTPVDRSG